MTAFMPSRWRLARRAAAAGRRTRPVWNVLKKAASGWMDHNAMGLSAALSFYAILALAPVLVIAIKVAGVVWRGKESARELISRQMTSLMGPQAADAVGQMVEAGGRNGAGVLATAVGTAVVLFSAAGVLVELRDGLNTVWGVRPGRRAGVRGFVRTRLLSLLMVAGVGLLLLASVVVSTVLAAAATYVAGGKSWLVILADVAVSFAVVIVLFAAVLKFLPDVRLSWRHVWLGAVITAALFTAGKYGLALYFKYAAPTSAFGAAGSLAAVLLWVYYSAFGLFFGAEFTRAWAAYDGRLLPPGYRGVV